MTAFMLLEVESLRSLQPRSQILLPTFHLGEKDFEFKHYFFDRILFLQEDNNGEVPKVLQRYTAEKLSSFGELALM